MVLALGEKRVSGHHQEGCESTIEKIKESKSIAISLTQGVRDRVTEMSAKTLVKISLYSTYYMPDTEPKPFPHFRQLNQDIRHLSIYTKL